MQNHKVVQKLFNVRAKPKIHEFTFAKPKKSLSSYFPDNQEDNFVYFFNKMTDYYQQTFSKYGLIIPDQLPEVRSFLEKASKDQC